MSALPVTIPSSWCIATPEAGRVQRVARVMRPVSAFDTLAVVLNGADLLIMAQRAGFLIGLRDEGEQVQEGDVVAVVMPNTLQDAPQARSRPAEPRALVPLKAPHERTSKTVKHTPKSLQAAMKKRAEHHGCHDYEAWIVAAWYWTSQTGEEQRRIIDAWREATPPPPR